jgi:hypothetical protein
MAIPYRAPFLCLCFCYVFVSFFYTNRMFDFFSTSDSGAFTLMIHLQKIDFLNLFCFCLKLPEPEELLG